MGYVFVKFSKTKWDMLPVFAQQTVYHVCFERQRLASLTSIPFPLHSTPFGSSVTQHNEGPMDTVSSIVDQTMVDEEEPSCD